MKIKSGLNGLVRKPLPNMFLRGMSCFHNRDRAGIMKGKVHFPPSPLNTPAKELRIKEGDILCAGILIHILESRPISFSALESKMAGKRFSASRVYLIILLFAISLKRISKKYQRVVCLNSLGVIPVSETACFNLRIIMIISLLLPL